jgi:hypothetical protein
MNHLQYGPLKGPSRAMTVVFGALTLLGALALWAGVRILLSPSEEPAAAIAPLLMGVTLFGAGVAVPVIARRARAKADRRERLEAAQPDKPWTWREDWASGRIAGSGQTGAVLMWPFALVWNAFTWPAAWLFLTQKSDEEHVYLVLIFPAAGVFLLGVAVYGSLQQRKFGQSLLVLKTNPGVIGRTLEGEVETRLESAPAGGVEARLACVRRYTTGTGKERKTRESTLWQDHITVPPADLATGFTGMRVPVAFEIPPDVPACDDRNPGDTIVWRLAVSAAVPGIDYGDSFDVPVFQTGADPLADAERQALRARRLAHAREYVPADPVIRITPTAHGGTMFSGRHRTSMASGIGVVAMATGCWVAFWYLLQADVPILPWVAAFFGLLFTTGAIVMLFHRSSVTVEEGTVVIRHRIFGIGPTRRLDAGAVSDVRAEVVGEGSAQSWEVIVKRLDGTSFSAVAHLPTQREADWTAEQIRAAIKASR